MIASTRKQAKKLGLETYYNGIYCVNGMNRFKRTVDGTCVCMTCTKQQLNKK